MCLTYNCRWRSSWKFQHVRIHKPPDLCFTSYIVNVIWGFKLISNSYFSHYLVKVVTLIFFKGSSSKYINIGRSFKKGRFYCFHLKMYFLKVFWCSFKLISNITQRWCKHTKNLKRCTGKYSFNPLINIRGSVF